MKKNNFQLKITEDNYKGYIELYKTFYMNKKEEKIMMGAINRLVVCGAISVVTILLTKDIIIFGILFASSTVINLGYGVTQSIKENKKRKQSIKNNYPYVDLAIERGELERALTREKILTTEYVENIGCFKLDVESYEKRLEEEKIRLEDLKGLNHFTETYVGPAAKAMAEHFSNMANTEDDDIESEISIEQSDKTKETILFEEFPKLKITEEAVLEHPERYTDCDVRTRMGKFYTDEEYEQRREEVLSRPLPGEEEKGPVLRKIRK